MMTIIYIGQTQRSVSGEKHLGLSKGDLDRTAQEIRNHQSKKPPQGGFLMNTVNKNYFTASLPARAGLRLLDGILESFCCAKLRYSHSGYLDSFTGTRIACLSGRTIIGGKDSKASDRHFTSFLECRNNAFNHGFYCEL